MTWTKLGDEFPDEAAVLSDQAFRLHVEALCWANRREVDLLVPKRDLRRFYNGDLDDAELYVNELLGRGWWIEQGAAWYLAKFAEWQIEKAQLDKRRERNADAQRRRRKHAGGDHSLCSHSLSLGDSPDDSRADSPTDQASDPGRDGSGRVRSRAALEDDHYVTGPTVQIGQSDLSDREHWSDKQRQDYVFRHGAVS